MEDLLTHYYLKQPEPIRGCLLALRDLILSVDPNINKQRKFQIPFFYYKDKKLAFLWVTKKKIMLGFVEDKTIYPKKEGIKLKDNMETMYIDPNADIPHTFILKNLKKLIRFYDKHELTK